MSSARKRSRNATLAWLTRQVVRAIDVAKAGLHWAFGETGPAHSVDESIRRHIIAGSVLVGVLAFGLGGWASTAEIAGALIAPGAVVVDSNIKKVQHPTGGVVGELFVHDGDHVKAGEILIRLDETVTRANLAIVTKGLTELYARKARLAAERDGADSVAVPEELAGHLDDPDVADALASERKLFDLRRQAARRPEKAAPGTGQPAAAADCRAHRPTGRQGQGNRADRAGARRRPRSVCEEFGPA